MKFITDSVWAKRGGIFLLIGLFLPLFVPTYSYYEGSDYDVIMFWDFLGGDVPGFSHGVLSSSACVQTLTEWSRSGRECYCLHF